MRHDLDLLDAYAQEREVEGGGESAVPLGFDATLARLWDGAFVVSDLPLSAVLDTAVAPIALATGTGHPQPAGLGCGWTLPPDGPLEWRPPESDR